MKIYFQMQFILGDCVRWRFTSDTSVNGWGWRFTVHPIMAFPNSNVRCDCY